MEEIKIESEIIEKVQEDTTDDEKKWCVYMHTNKTNGKKYIGITSQSPPEKRWMNGYGYKKHSKHFWNAIQKYGWSNFKHEVLLQNETFEYACRAERCLIKHYKAKDRRYGYNSTDGGEGTRGFVHTDEAKAIMSYKHKQMWLDAKYREDRIQKYKEAWQNEEYREWQKQLNIEKCKDPEKRKFLSGISKQAWSNEEFRKIQSEISKKRWENEEYRNKFSGENSHFYGKSLPDWHKEKLRQSCSGVNNKQHKPIFCIELNEIFWGARAAQKKYGFFDSNITKCCSGKSSYAYKHPITGEKLHWLYAKDAIEYGYIKTEDLEEYMNNLKWKGND